MKEIIEMEEVMELLGLSRQAATKLLRRKDCPTLPRQKGQKYRISKSALLRYVGANNK